MKILLYLLVIVTSNVVTAKFPPLETMNGLLIIPYGSLLVGSAFFIRDLVQITYGRRKTYAAILLALLLSASTSAYLGDGLWVVFASALSFAFSEVIDTEFFTRIKRSMSKRIVISGICGGFVDSAIFIVIGLSPIGAGMLTWNQVPFAIIGQIIVKVLMQFIMLVLMKNKLQHYSQMEDSI